MDGVVSAGFGTAKVLFSSPVTSKALNEFMKKRSAHVLKYDITDRTWMFNSPVAYRVAKVRVVVCSLVCTFSPQVVVNCVLC